MKGDHMIVSFMSKPGRTIGESDGIWLRMMDGVYQKGTILYEGNSWSDKRASPMDSRRRDLSIRAQIMKNGFLHQNLWALYEIGFFWMVAEDDWKSKEDILRNPDDQGKNIMQTPN